MVRWCFPEMVMIVPACVLILLIGESAGADHYCSRGSVEIISWETEGSIRTLYSGESVYQNNQNCAWIIDAGANQRVEITVVSSNLQWAPESSICTGYDHVAIKDAHSANSSGSDTAGKEPGQDIVLQWCGPSQPLGAISPGRYLRVEFMSDGNNPYSYTGVHLTFKTFSSSECAPSWKTGPTKFCYKLLNKRTNWKTAQQECNAERANLASINEDSELNFLTQTYRGSQDGIAWIGLNDISKQGSYNWIDGTDYKLSRLPLGQESEQFKRCVVFHFANEAWYLQNCDSYKAHPLCKSNTGNTRLYPIPKDEGKKVYKVPVAMIAGIVSGIIVLVIAILVFCICYKKRQKSHSQLPSREVELGHAARNTHEQNPGGESRVMPSAPPSYEEAISGPSMEKTV